MNNTPLPTCPKILKWLFVFFNVLFAILGILLIALGSWLVATGNQYLETLGTVNPVVQGTVLGGGALIIFCGLITFVLAALGVLGGICQARPLLVIFAAGLIIIVAIEFIGAILVLVAANLRPTFLDQVSTEMRKSLGAYSDTPPDNPTKVFVDGVQNTFDCCGISNFTDWDTTPFFTNNRKFPSSCCAGSVANCTRSSTELHRTGCVPAIETLITTNTGAAVVLGVIALLVLLVEISGIVIACGLCCCIRSAKLTLV